MAGRELTQSLDEDRDELDGDSEDGDSLARGTHNSDGTRVDSPSAQRRPVSTKPPPPPKDKNPDDPEDRLGTQLGSYRVTQLLGKGGMGYVYRAEHVKLGREVALKLLRADYARRRDAVARFIQEARTVNRIRHRNIVDVPDIVELDDGTTFIVMEFLAGQSLGKWARTGVDLPRALAVLVQICDGLAAAHAVGVVHRDLKPDNVMVVPTSDGAELVKLLDFGVAKLVNRDDPDIGFQTAAGSVIGTPAYMSPEQAGGMAIDARSDTYSLGAIMYELFTGQPMFRGRSFGEYVRKHLTERPVPPRQTAGGATIDDRLETIIMKCLEKEPAMRFSSIEELRDTLLGILGGIETRPPAYAAATVAGMPLRAPPSVETSPISHLSAVMVPTTGANPSLASIAPTPVYIYPNQTQQPSSLVVPPTGVQPPATTPLWVWIVGAMVAVGLGIGGATWYAKSSAPKPTPTTPSSTTTATPIVEPAPVAPELAHLKLDSLPAGQVFEDGHSALLCTTPCAFDVDPKTGAKHTYVVRAEGYRDAPIVVDLAGTERAFHVTLESLPPVVTPPQQPPVVADDPKPVVPTKTTTKKVTTKKTTKAVVETKKEPDPVVEPPPPPPKKTVPDEKVPDEAETLDPFKHKK